MDANQIAKDLPARSFLYTIDQIASLLSAKVSTVKGWLHYENRSAGVRPTSRMKAVDIAPAGEAPEWRVEEREFIRWLKHKGIRIYSYKLEDPEETQL
jgi:hypothetical protein